MVGFRDEKIDGDKMIITQGVIEKYYNRNEIIEYSDQLKPNETEKIKAQAGLRYTTSFKHPFGKGIIKEAIPPKIKTSIYEYFEPEIKETSITVEDATKLSSDVIFIYQEKRAYATKPTDEMRKSVKDDFDIEEVEVLPKSMYNMYIHYLSVDPVIGAIEAYLK